MGRFHALLQTPPPARGDAEQQLTELRDYLYTVVEELEYLLSHPEANELDDNTWQGIRNLLPQPSDGQPAENGTADGGTAPTFSRSDHVHPSDTGKADLASEIIRVSVSLSSLPQTVSDAAITANHEVVGYHMSNQGAMTGPWNWTTAEGSLTISGAISGGTALTVYLGLVGTTI